MQAYHAFVYHVGEFVIAIVLFILFVFFAMKFEEKFPSVIVCIQCIAMWVGLTCFVAMLIAYPLKLIGELLYNQDYSRELLLLALFPSGSFVAYQLYKRLKS